MRLVAYTVYDLVSGDVPRSGSVEEKHLPAASGTHGVLVGVRLNPNTHRVDPATRLPVARAVTKRAAWRAALPPAEPDEREVILEALKGKLTLAELAAARQKLRAART